MIKLTFVFFHSAQAMEMLHFPNYFLQYIQNFLIIEIRSLGGNLPCVCVH